MRRLLAPLGALAGSTMLAILLASRSGIALCGGHLAALTLRWEFAASEQLCPIVVALIALAAGYAAWAALIVGVDGDISAVASRVRHGRTLRSLARIGILVAATAALAATSAQLLSGSPQALLAAAVLTVAVFVTASVAALVANAAAALPLNIGRRIAIAIRRGGYLRPRVTSLRFVSRRSAALPQSGVCALALGRGLRAPPRLIR